jgi:two-component sensor histidine kinase
MSNEPPSRDLDWYRSQWAELADVLSVSDPDAVVDKVRRLQARVATMASLHEALEEAGIDDPEQAVQMIENMADQLEELYAERDRWGEPRFEHTAKPDQPDGDE